MPVTVVPRVTMIAGNGPCGAARCSRCTFALIHTSSPRILDWCEGVLAGCLDLRLTRG
jgi:hypothetical protein